MEGVSGLGVHLSGYSSTVVVALLFLLITASILLAASNSSNRLSKGLFSSFIGTLHDAYRSSRLFHALGRLLLDSKCPKGLPQLDPIERASDTVLRVLGCNPGSHTLQGTNTWLVGKGDSKILIDTGEDITSSTYVTMLLDVVFPLTETKSLSAILLTHGHGDHQGGVVHLLRQLKERDNIAGVKHVPPVVYKRIIQGGHFPHVGFPCNHIADGQRFVACSGVTLRAIYSPGHTDDHVCFVLEEEGALFSGDCVLGCGTTVFDDLYDYMNSLKSLRTMMLPSTATIKTDQRVPVIDTIYPGHGKVIKGNALEKVDEYIAHRMQREEQIYQVLVTEKKQHSDSQSRDARQKANKSSHNSNPTGGLTSWEIVGRVYGPISFFVKVSAQWNVLHHLTKLDKEGKAVCEWPDTWRLA